MYSLGFSWLTYVSTTTPQSLLRAIQLLLGLVSSRISPVEYDRDTNHECSLALSLALAVAPAVARADVE